MRGLGAVARESCDLAMLLACTNAEVACIPVTAQPLLFCAVRLRVLIGACILQVPTRACRLRLLPSFLSATSL